MEQFLEIFDVHGDERIAVEVFALLSENWACGHLSRECMVRGICARQFFTRAIERAVEARNQDEARQLVRVAIRTMHDRDRVWIHACRNFEEPISTFFQCEMNNLMDELRNLYSMSGIEAGFMEEARVQRIHRMRLDDTLSLVHLLFVPVLGETVVALNGVARFGYIGFAFYNKMYELQYRSPFEEPLLMSLRDIKREVSERIPVCRLTGFQRPVTHIAFIPEDLRPLFQTDERVVKLARYLEMDAKLFDFSGRREFPKMLKQKFGIEGGCLATFSAMMLRRQYGEGGAQSLVTHRLSEVRDTVEENALPAMMIKMHALQEIDTVLINDWICGHSLCQVCYLTAAMPHTQLPIIDTRLSEMLHGPDVVTVTSHAHGGDIVPRVTELGRGEVFRRLGDHWVRQRVYSPFEALVVIAKEIQLNVRGEGMWNGRNFHEAMCHLSRCFIYWDMNREERSIFYKLLFFALFGGEAFANGRHVQWDNMGVFIRCIFRGTQVPIHMEGIMICTILKLLRNYIRIVSQRVVVPVE
uniref:Non-structural protein NS1 n=1 Tax=Ife virus TaxID=2547357 RepID=A0A482A5J5_9REOV|nr:NS1 [Ife virus]